jgi:hypothetical protein
LINVTVKGIVKIEQKVSEITSHSQGEGGATTATTANSTASFAKRSSNKMLPAGCTEGNAWKLLFMPIYLRFAGSYSNGWTIDDHDNVAALQTIWDAVFGDKIPHTVAVNEHVFKVVSSYPSCTWACIRYSGFQATQRTHEWRSSFGSTAVAMFAAFFSSAPEERYASDESRAEFATKLLKNLAFVFEKTDGDNPSVLPLLCLCRCLIMLTT